MFAINKIHALGGTRVCSMTVFLNLVRCWKFPTRLLKFN